MFAGLDGGNPTERVIALATRTLDSLAGVSFLHGGDPSGWQDGHCDPSRLKAALLWSNLLLSTTTTLQLMSCKSQRNCPKSCSKQHLTQAWREPQLREDRLSERCVNKHRDLCHGHRQGLDDGHSLCPSKCHLCTRISAPPGVTKGKGTCGCCVSCSQRNPTFL